MAREIQVPGFYYSRKGEPVTKTPSQWRQLFSTHTRRVESGETFFVNKQTHRIEYEAYAIINVR